MEFRLIRFNHFSDFDTSILGHYSKKKLGIWQLFKNNPLLLLWYSQGSLGLSIFNGVVIYSIYTNFVSEIILSGRTLSKKSTLITDSRQAQFMLGNLILLKILFHLLKWQWNERPKQCQEDDFDIQKRAGLPGHLSWTNAFAAASSKAGWQLLLAQSRSATRTTD